MNIPKITVIPPNPHDDFDNYELEEIIYDIPNKCIRFIYQWDRFTEEFTIGLKDSK